MGVLSFLLYKYSIESDNADEYINLIMNTLKETREKFNK